MDIEEKKQKLEWLQTFFVKSFWLSVILLIFSSLLCAIMHDAQLAAVKTMFNIDEETFNWLIVLMLGIWKILIVQFTLIPALVLWCMRHCCKCKCECSNE
ncbi:MAG: hypothetical protein PHC64_02000 [Candidatus Gastranaerophilales bacterium]|nr:hypothetical protein [Candidatus Gastranaerophilales bacterium]